MKKVKILTIILAIILITMIAFIGIYTQVQNRMENKVLDYSYTRDLKGSRIIKLKINEGTETIIKDAEGNKVEDAGELTDEQLTEKGYTKEEVSKNTEEVKTVENYNKAKNIIDQRLKKMGVGDYITKLDETTGDIIIEMTENNQTDSIVSNVGARGKFEIIDTETKDVLMNNSDIEQVRVMYGQTSANSKGTSVYLEIKFNKDGTKKLEEITNKYVKIEEKEEEKEENTTSEENTTEESTTSEENVTEENTTDEEQAQEDTENEEEKENKEKTITMKIDDSEIMSTSFDEPIRTGIMQLTVGSSTTDTKTLQDNANQAANIANILDTEDLPIEYEVKENKYIQSEITENQIQIIEYIILGILAIGLLALIVRYKGLGILGVFSYIGLVSTFMLVIRYTNVVLSIEGILGIIMVLLFNYIFINKLLNKLNKKEEDEKNKKSIYLQTYKEFFVNILPVIIMVITFCFIRWIPISSFGMVMFWGILLIAIYNSIITNNLFKIKIKNQKQN